MITHLVPDILECKVKWAFGRITMNKASGGDGISADLFQILKDDDIKVTALNIPANLENSTVATRLENVIFPSSPIGRKCQRMFKQLSSSQFSSVQFSRSVMSDSLQPHELQHTRPPCTSPTPGVHLNSRPSSW